MSISAIQRLLPATVVSAEEFGDVDAPLFPVEDQYLVNAIDKRRREFATVRACATAVLAEFGLVRSAMVPGQQGEPSWPEGIVGSMTHCQGYRAAAAGREDLWRAIGIDAEPHESLPDGVLELVADPGERGELARLSTSLPRYRWDRILFSAKECVFKAWFPIARSWLGFEEATVSLDPVALTFAARIHCASRPISPIGETVTGRWSVYGGFILTALCLPRLERTEGDTET
ncbi:MAG: 4'-phosphopantetheinyl transferase superfamily protein [Tessaracoccus sp.]